MADSFRVNLFRRTSTRENLVSVGESSEKFGESSEKFGENSRKINEFELIEIQKNIISLIQENKYISSASIGEALGVSARAVEKNIRKLRENGILIRHGAARGGYWEIV